MRNACLLLFAATAAANELFKAIDNDNAAMVNIALKMAKPGVENAPNADGHVPLMYAVLNGKHRAFKVLLTKAKADPTVTNAEGYSVLQVAAEKGQMKMVQNLITHGVDINQQHTDGYTPLHRAVLNGHTDTVKALLNAEVPVDQPTADGKIAMELAETLDMATPVTKAGRRTPGVKSPQLAMKEVLQKFTRPTSGEKSEL